jgi:DNA-binding protein Fis
LNKAESSNGNGKVPHDLFQRLDDFHDLLGMLIEAHVTHDSLLAYVGKMYVTLAVEKADGNKSEAAHTIGLHRNSVQRILMGVRLVQHEEAADKPNSHDADTG